MEEVNNSLLAALNLQPSHRIISVLENGLSDANFILTHLMKKIFHEDGKLCLVILHNTLGHYHNVLKRLGHDLVSKLNTGSAAVVEPLKTIANEAKPGYVSPDKESIVKLLFTDINNQITQLLDKHPEQHPVYLIIDDVSHLGDLGVDIKLVTAFINYCINLAQNERVRVVINCHVSDLNDKIVGDSLRYVSDVVVDVSPLKTGISHEVTGVITITRRHSTEMSLRKNVLHYKAYDREIRTFAPGESIYHLYK